MQPSRHKRGRPARDGHHKISRRVPDLPRPSPDQTGAALVSHAHKNVNFYDAASSASGYDSASP